MANKSKSASSGRWLREHFSDPYVKQAQKAGYRSRAIFKLMEINDRDQLFKPGMVVVDLGAAPGSWAQWVVQQIKPQGKLIALDILAMDPIAEVDFIQGDFTEPAVLALLQDRIKNDQIDLVLSDMAPNMSGNASIDIPRAMHLVELALDFACTQLKPGGTLVMKVFQGEGFDSLLKTIKLAFSSVVIRKPKASRGRSREIYIVAKGLK